MAQRFGTKKELLIWLGKNPDDRRLVDRLMLRGEVHMENGMYVYESKEEIILGLESKVRELEREIENLKADSGSLEFNDDDLKEATVQWKYYEELYENEVLDKQNRIRKCFQWIKQKYPKADWEEFRDWVLED